MCLPNGSIIVAKLAGTICFSPHLHLSNVLYTSEFPLTLLSVSKLCQSLNCTFQFSDNKCFIQDVNTKRMIGLAIVVEGLYRIVKDHGCLAAEARSPNTTISSISLPNTSVPTTFINNCKVIPQQALWNFRLGHLSHARLSKLSQMYPSIFNDNKDVCDVCHYARHKKIPYTLSSSKAS